MTRRERLLTTLDHREPDRVPIAFEARPAIREALYRHFSVADDLALFDAMGIDGFSVFCDSYVYPRYIGPAPKTLADGTATDFFGIEAQRHAPLAFAETIADLDDYPWPSADWFDYSDVKARCRAIKARDLLTVGGEGGCGINHAIHLRGYELGLMDPVVDPEFTHAYMARMGDFFVEWNERWLAAAEGEFEVFRCGDEVGGNTMCHVRPEVWREFYKPQLKRVFAVAKRHGLKIWFHCCGYVRPLLPDLIEIGVDMWDPTPPTVRDNDPAALKREFGRDLTFIGGVNEPEVCVDGTPDDVRAEVRRRVAQLAPGGGYILGPSQNFTEDVPLDNVLALYDEALKCGGY
jgi:uroporphyrinogen decarboxylase